MPITPEEIEAIKAGGIAALSSPATMVRDGDQQVEMRTPAQVRAAIELCSELEDLAEGRETGLVVLCPEPVTL